MTFLVREALPDDLPAVLALYRHLNPADPDLAIADARPVWDHLLQSPMTTIAVAEFDKVLAATCMLAIIPNLTRGGRPFGVIENVVTDPAFRGRGLGTAVLHCAMQAAWNQGCYKIMLSSGRTEPSTLRFYEKAGFARGVKTFFEVRRL